MYVRLEQKARYELKLELVDKMERDVEVGGDRCIRNRVIDSKQKAG